MKKLIYASMVLLLGAISSSCEKENPAQNPVTPAGQPVTTTEQPVTEPLSQFKGVTVENGMLSFTTLEDYYAIVEDPNVETRKNFAEYTASLEFENYFTNQFPEPATKGAQTMDDFFGVIINRDNCIQIGKHVYRTDLVKEAVYVVDADKFVDNKTDLISGNIANKNISIYTLTDDVLSAANGIGEAKCHNPSSFEMSQTYNPGGNNETRCYLKYFTAGIYYRVTGRTKKIGNGYGGSVSYRFILECMNATTQIRRNPCNNSEVTSHAVGDKLNTLNDPEPVWEMYSKSWQIKHSIYIAIRSRVEVYGDISTFYFQTQTIVYQFN